MGQVHYKTVAACLKARDALGHFSDPGYKIGNCPKCETGVGCTGYYTKPIPETANERIANALRKLADQIEAGEWEDTSNICAVVGERLDRVRGDS